MRTVQEIIPGLFRLVLPMPFHLAHVNVYAFRDNGRVSLLDTGPNFPGTFDVLKESIKAIGSSIEEIKDVVVTHFHADHCGLAGRIQEISGAAVLISEIEYLSVGSYQEGEARIEKVASFCAEHGMDGDAVRELKAAFRVFKKATLPFRADDFLREGESVRLGSMDLEILKTPGHTRGHMCLFCRERGILLSGDHILPHITPNISADLLAPEFHPLASFIEALQSLRKLPVREVLPAHGEPFTDMPGRVDEILSHHRERKDLILASLKRSPKTSMEIGRVLFSGDLDAFNQLLAVNEVFVHLKELEEEGKIEKNKENGRFVYALRA
jgi:glyoxylase-like metal-dependent hydrolase (beta-lactamase superfamily II)